MLSLIRRVLSEESAVFAAERLRAILTRCKEGTPLCDGALFPTATNQVEAEPFYVPATGGKPLFLRTMSSASCED
jgi:hypothetical protein